MSKPENNQRSAHSAQLKKDIAQAVHVLQNLTNGFGKIESSLAEADRTHATERQYIEKITKLQQEITSLQDRCRSTEDQHQQDIVSFATASLHLTREFDARVEKKDQERQAELKGVQRREASQEQTLRRALDSQKVELLRLKETENASRNELELKLKEQKDLYKMREEFLSNKVRALENQVSELAGKNGDLVQELHEHQVMLKGRDTEISRLGNRLAALEAFSLDSPDQCGL